MNFTKSKNKKNENNFQFKTKFMTNFNETPQFKKSMKQFKEIKH